MVCLPRHVSIVCWCVFANCINACVRTNKHNSVCACAHVCKHVGFMNVFALMCAHVNLRVRAYKYVGFMNVFALMCAHVYLRVCVCVCVCFCMCV